MRFSLKVVRASAALLAAACASGKSTVPESRLASRDQPVLAIKGDTTPCAGAQQYVEVKNPSPREVTVAARTPSGLAPLSSDNLLRPFEKRRFVFPASVRLTGFSAWVFDPALGIGRNAEQMIDVQPKRSCS